MPHELWWGVYAPCAPPLQVPSAFNLCIRRGRSEGHRAILRHPPALLPALELDTHLNGNRKDAVN